MRLPRLLLVTAALAFSLGAARADEKNAQWLGQYVAISEALAADDLVAAKKASAELASTDSKLAGEAKAVAESDSLESARKKFRPLSKSAVALAKNEKGFYVMTCPMAKADWVQKDPQVANPYYGKSMLRCGSVKK